MPAGLPEPEILTDGIEMTGIERNDRYLEMREEEQRKLLEECVGRACKFTALLCKRYYWQ